MNDLNKLSKQIYEENKLRGFDVSKENIGQTLMLVVSELAEALEADRKSRRCILGRLAKMNLMGQEGVLYSQLFESEVKDTFEDEIADSLIRLFDLCGGFNVDIEKHIEMKLKYNATREYKHGKKY